MVRRNPEQLNGNPGLEQVFRNPTSLRANLLQAAFGGVMDLYKQAWLGSGPDAGNTNPFLLPLARMFGGSGPAGGLLGTMMNAYLHQLQQIIGDAAHV